MNASAGFELRVAIRHLRSGGAQTFLTISAVAAGVVIVVFITSLILGLHRHLTVQLTQSIPHIRVTTRDLRPTIEGLIAPNDPLISRRVQQRAAPQQQTIDNATQTSATIRNVAGVTLIVPVAQGQGFLSKGGAPLAVSLVGADPELEDKLVSISGNIIQGRYHGLAADQIVLDADTAKELALSTGDRVQVSSSMGGSEWLTVAGIYAGEMGRGTAYVTLRTGQSLLKLGTSVNAILVDVDDIYASDKIAARIAALVPYDAKAWLDDFPNIVQALKAQAAVAYIISAFSLVASAFAIAAILIVSVLRKAKQIGILKSMGARRVQIRRIFIFEGLGIALIGSTAGATIAIALLRALMLIEQPVRFAGEKPQSLFPIVILPSYVAVAMFAAIVTTVIAAWLPARNAANLNPVEVMR